MDDKKGNNQDDKSAEFLLAEFKYLHDCFWRNEELGDRRVNFFITITAAVIAASVALLGKDISKLSDELFAAFFLGLFAWLLFGIVTLMRMIRRNLVTDEYKRAQNKIKDYFIKNDKNTEKYLTYTTDKHKPREKEKIFSFENGGLVETVGLLNSIIVAMFVALLCFKFFGEHEATSCWLYQLILCMMLVIIAVVIAWALQM